MYLDALLIAARRQRWFWHRASVTLSAQRGGGRWQAVQVGATPQPLASAYPAALRTWHYYSAALRQCRLRDSVALQRRPRGGKGRRALHRAWPRRAESKV